jgi:membrane fusion protein (multidrug efflux system)
VSDVEPVSQAQNAQGGNPRARRKGFLILGLVVLVVAIAYAIYAFTRPSAEETDDAYVAGDMVTITARDPGTVLSLYADNMQTVKAGQPLIDLDPATADVELAAAEAQLAQAVRGVRASFSQVDEGGAAVNRAQVALTAARNDLSRRRQAAEAGAVSGEEVSHATDAVKSAQAALVLARSQYVQANTQVQGTSLSDNPSVLSAIAAYRRAAIRRSHMHVIAPVDGVIAQRNVQIGQQIAAGTPLMAIVPLRRAWVDANFRETQLKDIRIGQKAEITSDTYGGKIVYHGTVIGLSAGSGNAFALLPPQNASGNWIKIVQRVPVRIALDPKELDTYPLRLGMSVTATVSTVDQSGTLLGKPAAPVFPDQASDTGSADVEARIARIIAANRGR